MHSQGWRQDSATLRVLTALAVTRSAGLEECHSRDKYKSVAQRAVVRCFPLGTEMPNAILHLNA